MSSSALLQSTGELRLPIRDQGPAQADRRPSSVAAPRTYRCFMDDGPAVSTRGAAPAGVPAPPHMARLIAVHGTVQGVGFRPFVYRLAVELGLEGTVRNTDGHVVIET